MHEDLNLQRSSGREMCVGSITADDWGARCSTSPPVSVPVPQTTAPTQKRPGGVSEDKLLSGVSD